MLSFYSGHSLALSIVRCTKENVTWHLPTQNWKVVWRCSTLVKQGGNNWALCGLTHENKTIQRTRWFFVIFWTLGPELRWEWDIWANITALLENRSWTVVYRTCPWKWAEVKRSIWEQGEAEAGPSRTSGIWIGRENHREWEGESPQCWGAVKILCYLEQRLHVGNEGRSYGGSCHTNIALFSLKYSFIWVISFNSYNIPLSWSYLIVQIKKLWLREIT